MNPQHWTAVKELLAQALELPPQSRHAFVDSCSSSECVRIEAARLLAAMDAEDAFLEAPPRLAAAYLLESASDAAPQLREGDVLAGRFHVTRFLGRGGMGEVYEARDAESATQVAIKLIPAALSANREMLERFRQEMVLARAVTHRNVCRIFDLHHATLADGRQVNFLTMELITGETLAQHLERCGPLAGRTADNVLRDVAMGLAAAHEAGVVHGDLKPSNIMLAPTRAGGIRAVVMDFGLATVAAAEESAPRAGTPEYMAPEVVSGQPSTATSDVYAFGLLVHRALTGERPQRGVQGRINAKWAALVQRCLRGDPARRYQDAGAIVRALDTRWRGVRVAALAAAAIAVALPCWAILEQTRGPATTPAIAVLGFHNSTANPRADYLSLLLSLALDEELTATAKLRVIPASEVTRAKSGLQISQPAGPELLTRMRTSLGADFVAEGSYEAALNTGGEVRVHVDVRDASSGALIASSDETGREDDLPSLFARTGSDVRALLRLGPITTARKEGARAGLPGSLEAMRLYAEGLRSLRSFDTLTARDLLERAVATEPSYALAHSALASAWEALGYDERSHEEARKALDLTAPLLPEDRLLVEGSCWEALQQPTKAAQAYRTLLQYAPNNPDYLLLLAHVQTGHEMRDTLAALRRLPAPVRDDPRIDLAEAEGAKRADLYGVERAAAKRAIQKGRAAGATLLTAEADLLDAWASWILGQPRASESAYIDAEKLFSAGGDRNGVGRAMRGLALVAQYDGDRKRANELYVQALATFREIGSQHQAAVTLNGMAMLASNQGRLSEALDLYGKSLKLCMDVHNPICTGTELNNLGYVLFKTGRSDEAQRKFDDAAAAFQQGNGRYGQSFVLSSAGDMYAAKGRFEDAEKALQESLRMSRELGDRSSEASTMVGVGYLRMYQGRARDAATLARDALEIQRGLGERENIAKTRLLLAYADLPLARAKDAEMELRGALESLRVAGRRDDAAIGEALLANALAAQGRFEDARAAADAANRTLETSENELARVHVLSALGRAQRLMGDNASAARSFELARKEVVRCGFAGMVQNGAPVASAHLYSAGQRN